MGALASYFPSMEAELQDPEDFLGAGSLVEDRVASERADNDVQELTEIHASLEALSASMEADLKADPFTPVFINHALDAVGRRTGLRLPTASLEDATVSMEGLGGAIKAIWDAIVKAVKAAVAAVANFFRRIFELVAGKKKRIEANFEKAKKAGDVTPSKLADTNNLGKLADADVQAIAKKLKKPELAKCRKDQLVALTAAAATVVDRANILDGHDTIVKEEVVYKNESFTVVRREDVKRAKYVKLCQAGNDFISHASLAKVTLRKLQDNRCEINITDLTELVWETLYRGKMSREAGAEIAKLVVSVSQWAVEGLKPYFEDGGKRLEEWEGNAEHDFNNQLFLQMEAFHTQFRKFRSEDGRIPAGRRVRTFGPGKDISMVYAGRDDRPSLSEFTEHDVVMELPTFSSAKKASDGVTSLLVLNTQKNLLVDINDGFTQAIDIWDKALEWLSTQKLGDQYTFVSQYFTFYTNVIVTHTQNYFNAFMRSQLAMEGTVVGWGDMLSGAMARLADAKNLVEEFA